MIKDIVIAVSLILCLFQVEARPDGATILACDTLIPDHGINQVGSDPFPYKVDISNFVVPQYRFGYKGGRKYFVWLSGTLMDHNFRGFLIQARTVGDNSSVGRFSRSFSNKQVCIGDSAATHVGRGQKDFVTLYWTAPPAGTGPIRFWYSFVDINRKGRVRHWSAETSEVIQEVPSCPIKGQFYTTDCHLVNATCTNPYPVTKCNNPQCVCPRGQVIDEATNACINAAECCDICKINITGRVHYNKRKSRLRLEFSPGYKANGAIFECKLDEEEYSPCTSPKVWRKLNLSTKGHVATVKVKCIYNDDLMSTKSKRFRFQI